MSFTCSFFAIDKLGKAKLVGQHSGSSISNIACSFEAMLQASDEGKQILQVRMDDCGAPMPFNYVVERGDGPSAYLVKVDAKQYETLVRVSRGYVVRGKELVELSGAVADAAVEPGSPKMMLVPR